jgi:hypothetical protein
MKEIGIGWISDIFCDGVKIGGATIEGKLESRTSYEYLILSFAVNSGLLSKKMNVYCSKTTTKMTKYML